MMLVRLMVVGCVLLHAIGAYAQQEDSSNPLLPNHSGLMLYVGKDSQTVFRPILVNQFWTKVTHNNPGTATLSGRGADEWSTTMGVRRVRVLLLAELGPRVQAFSQIGINNQTFATGGGSGTGGLGGYGQAKKPQVFVHDAWAQYRAVYKAPDAEGFPTSVYLGAGLHYYHGLSRLSQAGIPSQLLLDFPIFNFPDIERGSQFARQFGVYAKGDLRRLHYRVAVNQPFITDGGTGAGLTDVAIDYPTNSLATSAYVEWRFGDWEGHTLPFRPMTYIGGKRILNVGAGYYLQANATASYDLSVQTGDPFVSELHHKRSVAVDVFTEQPVGDREAAVTGYLAFYDYDFGPDYYRSFGLLNTAPSAPAPDFTGSRVVDGFGNAEPLMGSGNILHLQLGYLLPRARTVRNVRYQVFGALSRKSLDFLDVPATKFDLGGNVFLRGHAAKLSVQLGLRPQVFATGGGFEARGHRGELVVQMQVAL